MKTMTLTPERFKEIEERARDAAYKIMVNTDACSRTAGGTRFTFQEYQDEVQAVIQEAITSHIAEQDKEIERLREAVRVKDEALRKLKRIYPFSPWITAVCDQALSPKVGGGE